MLRARDSWVEKFLGDVPEGCFDVTVMRVIVRTRSLSARSRPDEPEIYRQIRPATRFDGIARGRRWSRLPAGREEPRLAGSPRSWRWCLR